MIYLVGVSQKPADPPRWAVNAVIKARTPPERPGDYVSTRHVDTPTARQVADWSLVKNDLQDCIASCNALLNLPSNTPNRSVLARSLWAAAVVSYSRCYGTGVREVNLRDRLPEIEDDPVGVHDHFTAWRNKHVAHSVNHFEAGYTQVVIGDDGDYQGDGMFSLHVAQPNTAELKLLRDFAIIIQKQIVDPQILRLRGELKAEVKAMTPEERLALPDFQYSVPGLEAMHRGRSRTARAPEVQKSPREPTGA